MHFLFKYIPQIKKAYSLIENVPLISELTIEFLICMVIPKLNKKQANIQN